MPHRRKFHAIAAVENALLRCVRVRGTVARGELSTELGLVPSTIGVYVERLVHEGYLLERVATERGLGRPPVVLQLNPQRGRFIGVDFDARQMNGVTTDFAQRVLGTVNRQVDEQPSRQRTLDLFELAIEELIGDSADDVMGIGIGLPGIVDSQRGVGRECGQIDDWHDVPLADFLSQRFGVPVSIESNLRSVTLAEYWFGGGRGVSRLACLSVRTGIAVGIVVDGKLYRGANNIAGEIGLWICPVVAPGTTDSGPPAITPTTKTIAQMASLEALLSAATERLDRGETSSMMVMGSRPTVESLLQAAGTGDHLAANLVSQVAVQHAWILHHVALLLDPDVVVLVGPLAALPDYVDHLRATYDSIGTHSQRPRIVATELGAAGAALGAAAVAIQNWSPRRDEPAGEEVTEATNVFTQ